MKLRTRNAGERGSIFATLIVDREIPPGKVPIVLVGWG
jgi:hypothetical protein